MQYCFLLFLLIILLIYFWIGELLAIWILKQESFSDQVRMNAYYIGYIPMMILPSLEEEIKTKHGFSIFASPHESTLVKCFHLVNDYEPSLVEVMLKYLKIGLVMIDVGANEGYFTLLAASRGAKVYAIEPSQDNLKLLKRNITKNNFDHSVTIFPYAAGDENRITTFHQSQLNGMWSSVGPGKTNFFSKNTQVEMKRLEEIILEIPDLVKIDVEGFEEAVLAGAQSWLQDKKTVWIIETDDTTLPGKNIIQIFHSLDYYILTLPVDSTCLPGRCYYPKEYKSNYGFGNFIFIPNKY